ncbi:hypothetical protein D3C75_908640 [compost metagenome]
MVYVLSLIPALPGRNKYFSGLSGFPLNNHNIYTRLFQRHNPPHPVHRRFSPFHGVTTIFQLGLRAWLALYPTPNPDGGSYFSRNGFSML